MASSGGDGRRNYYIIRCNQPDTKFLNGTKSSVDASHECSCARRDEAGTKPGQSRDETARNESRSIRLARPAFGCGPAAGRDAFGRRCGSFRFSAIAQPPARAASRATSASRRAEIVGDCATAAIPRRIGRDACRSHASKPRIETANRNRPLKPIRRSMTPRAAERIPHVPSEFAPIRPRAPRSRARTRRMLRRKSSREDGPHRF
ncbi:hypothetical protein [Burkholderia savannae]|uniref:hypothetical protein n=1 Tax=Burkholderia savannae TaxID=1637837 RepID=UPI0012F4BFCA|nr:hypothetical protein [Burkholderia savannae]